MDAEHTYVSTRWNPKSEQLQILRDLYYNHGMRNPSRQEIMGITQRLSQYGKIEEKNVFYWFQNQKGRERQQRKRLATLAAEAATPHDMRQQATVGGSSEHATKHPMLETLPLFPMHSDRVGKSKADTNNSEPSLELTLRPYSPTP
nr:wuschel [Ipomoea batatas]